MPRTTVAFVAAPYGFGPSSKAIAISSILPPSVERIFVGQGPSLDMARQSKEFASCVNADFRGDTTSNSTPLLDYDMLVFINSTRFMSASVVAKRPTFLVDTLAWLRQEPPPNVAGLHAFFGQRFFNHRFSPAIERLHNFRAVGPIMPKNRANFSSPQNPVPRRLPIVHFGGLYSPMMVEGACESFLNAALDALNAYPEEVRIILPAHLHKQAESKIGTHILLLQCSAISVHDYIAGSEFALTTAGIEFSYESILAGVPTVFLPAFNSSQVFQLNYHRKWCSASVPLRLDCMSPCDFSKLHETTAAIQRRGMEGFWRKQFDSVTQFLSAFRAETRRLLLDNIREHQQSQVKGLDGNGANIIAAQLLRKIGVEALT